MKKKMTIKSSYKKMMKNVGTLLIMALMIASSMATTANKQDDQKHGLVLADPYSFYNEKEQQFMPVLQNRDMILFEGFENYTPGTGPGIPSSWGVYNEDDDGYEWEATYLYPYEGNWHVRIHWHSYGYCDDWLITPLIHIPATGDTFEFYTRAYSSSYPEEWQVWITDVGNTPDDFLGSGGMQIGSNSTGSTIYSLYSYQIPTNYHDVDAWIAIRCVSYDAYYLFVDAVSLPSLGFFEGFEGSPAQGWPPSGWTHVQYNPVDTWNIDTNDPHSGKYLTSCTFSTSSAQNEWLISPSINLGELNNRHVSLSFFWKLQGELLNAPIVDCSLLVSPDGGQGWVPLWSIHDEGVFNNNTWYETVLDLTDFAGRQNIKIGFLYNGSYYNGTDTGAMNLDDIRIYEVSVGKTWVEFRTGYIPGTSCEVLPKSRDTTGFCIDSNFYGMYVLNATVNYTNFHRLNIPNAFPAGDVGKPAVPVVTRFFEIPYGVTVNVSILYTDEQTLDGYYIIPIQEDPENTENATIPPFTMEMTTYTTDAFFPADLASVQGAVETDTIIIRGVRIVAVSLYPVQFNPVTQQIKIHSKIEVKINYDNPAQVDLIDSRLKSRAFDELCHNLILNYQYRPDYSRSVRGRAEGAEYLILTYDDFYEPVKRLADWKEKKGFITKIVKTSEINIAGPSSQEIVDYIHNAYDTWDPAPSYLLLVGDSDNIPVCWVEGIPTDLCYGDVDGHDLIADILVGRLSVDTVENATVIVDKILDYERYPPGDAVFYSHISVCSYFEDDDKEDDNNITVLHRDGYENTGFVYTSEALRDYLTNWYTVERIYNALGGVNPTNYSPAPTDQGSYDNGDPLPPELLRPHFSWNGDKIDITNAIEEGRFLVIHRDHGGETNWMLPSYNRLNIRGLNNGDLLPVVYSINCGTGNFTWDECFCEEFLRKPNGGAIAVIGATTGTATGRNDHLVRGFIDATWEDFDPDYGCESVFSLGQVLTYGKAYMAHVWKMTPRTEEQFLCYHLFGDPEMKIWTKTPLWLNVWYPTTIGSEGTQTFVVSVTEPGSGDPVQDAQVCLQKPDDIYEVGFTNEEGEIIFNISPCSGGEINITVTKHNYQPYEDSIDITSNGAVLTIDTPFGRTGDIITLEGHKFNGTEMVDILFPATPAPVHTYVLAPGGDFQIDLSVPEGTVGHCNVIATGNTSGRVGVAVFERLPEFIDLYTYCQWDRSTWYLSDTDEDPTWDSPCIKLYDTVLEEYVSSRDLLVGREYRFEATVYNNDPDDAVGTFVTFYWIHWGVGEEWKIIDSDMITVPGLDSAIASITWTPVETGHLCLNTSINHPLDNHVENNRGQENTHVHAASSPAVITFNVTNPTDTPTLVYLDLLQKDRDKAIWSAALYRDYPQVLNPNETKPATVIVDVPPEVPVGENRTFKVTAYIDDVIIGGVEFQVVKDNVPYPPTSPIPENNTLDVPINTYLGWFGGDPDAGDTVAYDIYLGSESPIPYYNTTPQYPASQTSIMYTPSPLNYNTTYYWQIVARDNHKISTTGPVWIFTTLINYPPVYSAPSPANGSTGNPLSFSWSIPISDPDGDTFSWTIQCSNGQTNSGTGASNGTKTLTLSGLAYGTIYTVWVNATDPGGSGLYTRQWYTFTTKINQPPIFGIPTPSNGSTNNPLSLTWSIPINDPEGNLFDWTIQCSNGQTNSETSATNGTKSLSLSGLGYLKTYKIWVNATDPGGSNLYTRKWYTFTTKASQPPVFGTSTPSNGSTNNPLSLTWGIPINDPEGDLFSWTIQCSNGQTNSGTGATNGTKSLALSGLAYATTYTVWVNATDPTGSGLWTRRWYTFTTKANQPPNPPTITGPTTGKINVPTEYNVTTTDPENDHVYYFIDWGDTTNTSWIGDYASGELVTKSHTWTQEGTYIIKAKAKDVSGAESDWSTLQVSMPLSYKSPYLQFFAWFLFFERFPHAFPLLRQILRF